MNVALLISLFAVATEGASSAATPFALGIVGLVHDHVNEATYGLPSSLNRTDITIVGMNSLS